MKNKETLEVPTEKAVAVINENKNSFFKVTFIKRTTGELRVMTCRLGVKKYLKGGELKFDPKEKNVMPVFDMTKMEYRLINLDTLIELDINGKRYIIKDEI